MGSVPFFERARMPYALRVLGWSLEKLNLLKDMRRLLRIDSFESGHDNYIVPMKSNFKEKMNEL